MKRLWICLKRFFGLKSKKDNSQINTEIQEEVNIYSFCTICLDQKIINGRYCYDCGNKLI
jgi:hypothetical protein